MSYVKTIVCFANSRKMAGRCIAGKEWQNGEPGEWVRPVSSRPSHEVSEHERYYESGGDPELLDILCVSCDTPQPLPHQRENHVINPKHRWKKVGHLPWEDINSWLDNPENLWGTGESSYAGWNNRLSVGRESGVSLYLVPVEHLRLLVGYKAPGYPKRRVRGEFVYKGVKYCMDVTDPVIERDFLMGEDGQYDIPDPVLCVSLSDPYLGYYYKLIAAVLYSGRLI